ncbi:peroxiredoxin [Fluviispira vulneris]|uniref:peroxiredoxin n=1 Tax=Fluviispira vulneris TaxID=2763012 RepID=UPI0016440A33|nr:peroxiredoxin [Fluviispira vulneris]
MSRILSISQPFPNFSVPAVVSLEQGKEFITLNNDSIKGKWSVFFFWPLDFTFVCPTEIAEFNKAIKQFHDRDCELYGASTDSQYVHLAWRKHHEDLKNLEIAMLADNKKELSEALGILHPVEKVPLRATFIVDPEGIIRWVSANDLSVGRNVKEVIRVLDALQTDELCPCNWEKGQATLK